MGDSNIKELIFHRLVPQKEILFFFTVNEVPYIASNIPKKRGKLNYHIKVGIMFNSADPVIFYAQFYL